MIVDRRDHVQYSDSFKELHTGLSSKYFDVVEIVGIWRSFEFR